MGWPDPPEQRPVALTPEVGNLGAKLGHFGSFSSLPAGTIEDDSDPEGPSRGMVYRAMFRVGSLSSP